MKLFLISFFVFPVSIAAQLRVAPVFSDNMVLQRDKPVHFWGKGIPGKTITISFAKSIKKVTVKIDSSWSVYFNKQVANTKPQSVIIRSSEEKIELKNILIGDIWICSGQSNMEWTMQREMHWKEEKNFANQPLVRFTNPPFAGKYVYGVAYADSLNRRLTKDSFYLWNGWKVCDSSTIKTMSAVAYYFAKSIVSNKNIPVGLINLSVGGAPLESFISRDVLQSNKEFAGRFTGNWLQNNNTPYWARERGQQNVGSNPNAIGDDMGPNHAYKPGFAYEAGIVPLRSMPVMGILFYQGESNSQEIQRVNEYAALSKLMIDDYRKQWGQTTLPFYFVQLSSIDTAKYKSHFWPKFRDEQRKMLQLIPHSGMAVCSDIGSKNDVHPTNKKDVGERLARWALNKTYHQNIVPSGPLPVNAKYVNGKIIISFQYIAKGLKTSDGNPLRGFSIDGKNDAEAILGDSGIIIPVNTKPQFIYYGWKPFSDGNLVNSENLPASTFKISVK
ncbi:MAG: hypothetical protein KDB99_05940 [Chitinophagaceae bacterium]|nr:hypothetical protein [Chitinophagaceae bacterium]MCB9056829.1 sialate O-acetylesterase [Chitinophagales bacterium]